MDELNYNPKREGRAVSVVLLLNDRPIRVTTLRDYVLPINFHTAPPEYPGVGGCSMALYDKRETFGVTAHVMTDAYDAGPILKVIAAVQG